MVEEPLARGCARLLAQRTRDPELDQLAAVGQVASPPSQPGLAYEEISAPRALRAGVAATSPAEPPALRTAILLHGLLGSGRNWRTWTRKTRHRAGGARLRSDKPVAFHSWTCATTASPLGWPWMHPRAFSQLLRSVVRLVRHSPWGTQGAPAGEHGGGAAVVVGHSVGGKVALEYARLCAAAADAGSQGSTVAPPQQVRPFGRARRSLGLCLWSGSGLAGPARTRPIVVPWFRTTEPYFPRAPG